MFFNAVSVNKFHTSHFLWKTTSAWLNYSPEKNLIDYKLDIENIWVAELPTWNPWLDNGR
jgi:hypothetical protein